MALHHIDIFYISDFTVLNQNFRNLVRLIRRCGYCNFISSILQIFGAVLAKHIGIENSFCFCSFLSPGSSSSWKNSNFIFFCFKAPGSMASASTAASGYAVSAIAAACSDFSGNSDSRVFYRQTCFARVNISCDTAAGVRTFFNADSIFLMHFYSQVVVFIILKRFEFQIKIEIFLQYISKQGICIESICWVWIYLDILACETSIF